MVWGIIATVIAVATAASSYFQQKKLKKQAAKQAQELAAVQVSGHDSNRSLYTVYGETLVGSTTVWKKVSDKRIGFSATGFTTFSQATGGALTNTNDTDSNRWFYRVVALSNGPIESVSNVIIDGEGYSASRFSQRGDTFHFAAAVSDGPTAGRFFTPFNSYSEFGLWNSAMTGKGVAYAAERLYLHKKSPAYQGEPSTQYIVKGRKVYDPRKDSTSPQYDATLGVSTHRTSDVATWQWSDNPAICLLDYLVNDEYGRGLDYSDIDLQSIADSADSCDVPVAVPARLVNDTSGIVVVVDVFSGVTTEVDISENYPNYRPDQGPTQPRFKLNMAVDGGNEVLDNVQSILNTFRAHLVYANGRYIVKMDDVESSVLSLNDDDIIGGLKISEGDRSQRMNRATVKFNNNNKQFKTDQVSWPEIGSTEYNAYLADDQDEKLHKTFTLEGCTDFYQAEDTAEFLVRDSRVTLTARGTFGPRALGLVPGDVISLTYDSAGYSGKFFRVRSVSLNISTHQVQLELQEYDSSVYTWNANKNNEPLGLSWAEEPFNLEPPAPTIGTVTEGVITRADGSTTVTMAIPYADVPSDADSLEVSYKVSTASEYQAVQVLEPEDQTSQTVVVDTDDATYDVRIRYFVTNNNGRTFPSAYDTTTFTVSALTGTALDNFVGGTGVNTFSQASTSVPTAIAAGDIWFTTDTGKQYLATNAGDNQIVAGEWEIVSVIADSIDSQGDLATSTAVEDDVLNSGLDVQVMGTTVTIQNNGTDTGSGTSLGPINVNLGWIEDLQWQSSTSCVLTRNAEANGNANDGEVRIQAGKLKLTNGSVRTTTQTQIQTPYEGSLTILGGAYIIWGNGAAYGTGNRFTTLSQFETTSSNAGLFLAKYSHTAGSWQAVDNGNNTENFTPAEDDVAIALMFKTSTSGGIDSLTMISTQVTDPEADVTSLNTALNVTGQGTLATANTVNLATTSAGGVSGLLPESSADTGLRNSGVNVSLSGQTLALSGAGSTSYTMAQGNVGLSGVANNADQTSLNTALNVTGQGSLATQSTVALGSQVSGTLAQGSGGTGLTSTSTLQNSNVTINADGSLSGAGSGQVTAPGLGVKTLLGTALAGTAVITGNKITMSGLTNGWNKSWYSKEGYVSGCFCSATCPTTSATNIMMGLNSDPTGSASWTNLDYAWHWANGNIYIYESGSQVLNAGAFNSSTVATIMYTGSAIKYYLNGSLTRTVTIEITNALYLDFAFYENAARSLENVNFGPISSNRWADVGGTGTPLDNADVTSLNTALNVTGQGTLATANTVNLATTSAGGVTGLLPTSSAATGLRNSGVNVSLSGQTLALSGAGSTSYTMAQGNVGLSGVANNADKTSLNTALNVTGQGTLATANTVNLATTSAGGVSGVLPVANTQAEVNTIDSGDSVDLLLGATKLEGPTFGAGTLVIRGTNINKTSGSGWNAGYHSEEGYVGGMYVTCTVARLADAIMFGLSDAPTSGTLGSYQSIDYAIYQTQSNGVSIYESGLSIGGFVSNGVLAVGDQLTVMYDGSRVTYLRNGSLLRTVVVENTNRMYATWSFYDSNSELRNISYGPVGSTRWGDIAGADIPANNADVTSGNTALGITGQGTLATSNKVNLATTANGGVTGLLPTSSAATGLRNSGVNVSLSGQTLALSGAGSTSYTMAQGNVGLSGVANNADKTSLNTALNVTGQGTLATQNSVTTSQVPASTLNTNVTTYTLNRSPTAVWSALSSDAQISGPTAPYDVTIQWRNGSGTSLGTTVIRMSYSASGTTISTTAHTTQSNGASASVSLNSTNTSTRKVTTVTKNSVTVTLESSVINGISWSFSK